MELKQNQAFFSGTYSNNAKIFQWLLLELFNFIVKVNTIK